MNKLSKHKTKYGVSLMHPEFTTRGPDLPARVVGHSLSDPHAPYISNLLKVLFCFFFLLFTSSVRVLGVKTPHFSDFDGLSVIYQMNPRSCKSDVIWKGNDSFTEMTL